MYQIQSSNNLFHLYNRRFLFNHTAKIDSFSTREFTCRCENVCKFITRFVVFRNMSKAFDLCFSLLGLRCSFELCYYLNLSSMFKLKAAQFTKQSSLRLLSHVVNKRSPNNVIFAFDSWL